MVSRGCIPNIMPSLTRLSEKKTDPNLPTRSNRGARIGDKPKPRALGHLPLEALAQRIEPKARWDALVLPAKQVALLRRIARQVRVQAKANQERDAGKFHRSVGALFSGGSATARTLAAEVIAVDLRHDLYRVDLSAVVSKYIGETEKKLQRVFDAAESSGAILFFDEADALFGKRTEVTDSHDRYANIEIDYLLQRMEAYRGLAILATNMKSSDDQAFLRRLRFIVEFPKPAASERESTWRKGLPSIGPDRSLDDVVSRSRPPRK